MEIAAYRAKISSILSPWGKMRVPVYVQLLELWPIATFHAQIWKFANRLVSRKLLPNSACTEIQAILRQVL